MTAAIDGKALRRFRDIIARRLGMACDDAPQDHLTRTLGERLRAAGGIDADRYLDHLDDAPPHQPELRSLAEGLTVTETYFFRHLDQITAFGEVALPERARARAGLRRLRILSAGCSSGEEPYTLAMEVAARLPPAAGWDIAITGVDISDPQIARARRGVYSEWALRATPDEVRAHHFHGEGRDFRLDDRIRAAVAFENRNLMDPDPEFWADGRFDIIFCRNVLMYFTAPAMHAVVGRLARALAPGGFLFLGSAETLRGVGDDFQLCHSHDTFYYRRHPVDQPAAAAVPPPPRRSRSEEAPAPDAPSWHGEIAKASDRIAALLDGLTAAKATEEPGPALDAPVADAAPGLQAIRTLLHRERYQDAMRALSRLPAAAANDPDTQLLLAVVLTQQSDITVAERVCRHLLSLDDRNAGAHYLMALCADQGGDHAAAWEHDRAAASLDPGFAMPHVHMGRLAKADRRFDAAERAFRHAHALLEREEVSRILLFGGGFNREALLRLCRAELLVAGGRA